MLPEALDVRKGGMEEWHKWTYDGGTGDSWVIKVGCGLLQIPLWYERNCQLQTPTRYIFAIPFITSSPLLLHIRPSLSHHCVCFPIVQYLDSWDTLNNVWTEIAKKFSCWFFFSKMFNQFSVFQRSPTLLGGQCWLCPSQMEENRILLNRL